MWNPLKIYKYSKSLFERGPQDAYIPDANGEERLEEVQGLYREMMFPSNLAIWKHLTSTRERRPILWGSEWNDEQRVNEKVIPLLKDKEYLQSLPSNTIGAHFAHFYTKFDITELYEKRFLESEENKTGAALSAATDHMRTNIARHQFLSHDLYHILTRYDTASFGEGLVQTFTWHQIRSWPMWYIGFLIASRMAWRYKSLEPYAIMQEASRMGRAAYYKDLVAHSPVEFLEMDLEEARKKFGITAPVKYLAWTKEHPETYRGDTANPLCAYSEGWMHGKYDEFKQETVCL